MKGKNKKTYRRKKLDIVKTLKAYENRIMSLPQDEFEVLRDKYISSYEVWDTFQNDEILEELRMRHGTKFDNIAFRLYLVARVKGIHLKGITSQKKLRGKRAGALKEGESEEKDCFYVGPALNFENRDKLERSVFSMRYEDRRFILQDHD